MGIVVKMNLTETEMEYTTPSKVPMTISRKFDKCIKTFICHLRMAYKSVIYNHSITAKIFSFLYKQKLCRGISSARFK